LDRIFLNWFGPQLWWQLSKAQKWFFWQNGLFLKFSVIFIYLFIDHLLIWPLMVSQVYFCNHNRWDCANSSRDRCMNHSSISSKHEKKTKNIHKEIFVCIVFSNGWCTIITELAFQPLILSAQFSRQTYLSFILIFWCLRDICYYFITSIRLILTSN
jgi:hypothetical protein